MIRPLGPGAPYHTSTLLALTAIFRLVPQGEVCFAGGGPLQFRAVLHDSAQPGWRGVALGPERTSLSVALVGEECNGPGVLQFLKISR